MTQTITLLEKLDKNGIAIRGYHDSVSTALTMHVEEIANLMQNTSHETVPVLCDLDRSHNVFKYSRIRTDYWTFNNPYPINSISIDTAKTFVGARRKHLIDDAMNMQRKDQCRLLLIVIDKYVTLALTTIDKYNNVYVTRMQDDNIQNPRLRTRVKQIENE